MANRLTMAEIDKILTLHTTAHSNREMADLLAINRETVGKYLARYKAQNRPDQPSVGAPPSGTAMPGAAGFFGQFFAQRPAQRLRTFSEADSLQARTRAVGEAD